MTAPSNQVSVRVGIATQGEVRATEPRIVVVSMADSNDPSIADTYPAYRIARQRSADGGAGVDHVRLPLGASLDGLPSLTSRVPSMVRDAVGLAFAAGARTVDVVIARGPEAEPWETGTPLAFTLLRPVLEKMPAVAVVFPDAAGPGQIGTRPTETDTRLTALVFTVRTWANTLAENYQVGFVDMPDTPDSDMFEALQSMANADVALCAWRGQGRALKRHGWRSAAAFTAGMLMSRKLPTDSLLGRRVALPGGRPPGTTRMQALGVPPLTRDVPEFASHATVLVELDHNGDSARIVSENTLRSPVGSWTVPMLRTAKLVHNRVASAADLMTFADATIASAFLLQSGIQVSLDDFVAQGVLTGADPSQPPEITARPDPRRDAPALVAEVTAYMRPWVRRLHLNLHVRPGGSPDHEAS